MPNRLNWKIAMVPTIMLIIAGTPALAHGGSSVGHSSRASSSALGRVGGFARSVGRTTAELLPGARPTPAPAASTRMLVTTAPSVAALAATSRSTSAVRDPPVADPPAASAPTATTSPLQFLELSAGGVPVPGFTSPSFNPSSSPSQSNPGTQDLTTSAVSLPTTTDITSISSTPIGSQLVDTSAMESAPPPAATPPGTEILPNTTSTGVTPVIATATMIGPGATGLLVPSTTTSGAVPQSPTSGAILPLTAAVVGTEGEVIATSGGSSGIDIGATGRNMPECMAAWDQATHITKTRWRVICARTLREVP